MFHTLDLQSKMKHLRSSEQTTGSNWKSVNCIYTLSLFPFLSPRVLTRSDLILSNNSYLP